MINDLPDIIKNCKIRLFADDGSLLIKGPLSSVYSLVQALEWIFIVSPPGYWLSSNRLQMNYEEVLFVFPKPAMSNALMDGSIRMNFNPIRRTNSVKILGCYVDETMSSSEQLSFVNKKFYLSSSPLFPLRKIVSQR
jgi:predicted AAA+ superfamily ATPase